MGRIMTLAQRDHTAKLWVMSNVFGAKHCGLCRIIYASQIMLLVSFSAKPSSEN